MGSVVKWSSKMEVNLNFVWSRISCEWRICLKCYIPIRLERVMFPLKRPHGDSKGWNGAFGKGCGQFKFLCKLDFLIRQRGLEKIENSQRIYFCTLGDWILPDSHTIFYIPIENVLCRLKNTDSFKLIAREVKMSEGWKNRNHPVLHCCHSNTRYGTKTIISLIT